MAIPPFGSPPAPVKQLVAGSNISLSPSNGKGTVTISASVAGASSPLTTLGDLYGYSTMGARLPVAYDGIPLQSASVQALGLGYGTQAYNLNGQSMMTAPNLTTGAFQTFTDNGTPTLTSSGAPTYNSFVASPSVAGTGTSSAVIRGFYSAPTVTGAYVGELTGFESLINCAGSGTQLIGYGAVAGVQVPSGTLTNATGVLSAIRSTGGSVTTGVCYDTSALNVSGTFTTAIGLRVQNMGGATSWGVQIGNYNSYFQGFTSFGQTAAPNFTIDATGTISSSNTSTSAPGFLAALTGTPAANKTLAGFSDTTLMPIGSGSGAAYASFAALPTITGSGNATYYGARVVATSTGAYTGSPVGGSFVFNQNGSGTIPVGTPLQATWESSAGSVTTAYGVKTNVITAGGTVVKWIGFGISAFNVSGTLSTVVGLDIGVTSPLTGATTAWAMQIGGYNSYFAGMTAFGGTSVPTWDIHVQGAPSATTAIGVDVSTTAPTSPAASVSAVMSVYQGSGNNKYFMVTFNDAGQVRYRYMPLNGTSTTWTENTSLPT